jgi:succinoglycan biosynthesis protein ExoO
MASPRIAAVIPVFNKQAFVGRAIESVLAQTRPADEIVIVDDASTDGSLAVVEGFRDARIRIVRRTESAKRGVAAARNLAIRTTTCDWVAFLDADDVWLPEFLQVAAGLAAEAPAEVGCVFTGWRDVWEDGGWTPDPYGARHGARGPHRLGFEDFIRAWIEVGQTPMSASAVALRRDILLSAGLFHENCRRGEDKDMWLRAMAGADAISSPSPCGVYDRAVPNQASATVTANVRHCVSGTLERMIPQASGERQRLLKRLFNIEALRSARQVGLRERLRPEVYRGFYVSLNPALYALLIGLSIVPGPLQRALREIMLGAGLRERLAGARRKRLTRAAEGA